MTRPRSLTLATVLFTCCSLSFMAPARAEPDAAEPATSAARGTYGAAITDAVRAYNDGRFADARAHFAAAHALKPNARTLRGLGSCALALAHYEDAERELSQALEEPRGALSPSLRAETEAMLASAREKLAASARVAPPDLLPDPPPPTPPPAIAEPAPESTTRPDRRVPLLRGGALASTALGLAGLAVGTIYGVRSLREGDVRDRYCSDGLCRAPRGVEAGNAAIRNGNIATAGFLVGGVALAGALALGVRARWLRRMEARNAQLSLAPYAITLGGSL